MIELHLSEDISGRLAAAIKATEDLTPLMAAVADVMRSGVVASFDAEIGPDGIAWQPSQRALASGGKTLTDRGHLRGSIVAMHDSRAAIAGTNLVYAAIHQWGGAVRGRQSATSQNVPKPRNMPARPFLGFSADAEADIAGLIDTYLRKALAGGAA